MSFMDTETYIVNSDCKNIQLRMDNRRILLQKSTVKLQFYYNSYQILNMDFLAKELNATNAVVGE